MPSEIAKEFEILKRQLRLAPRQVRVRQLERIEELLADIAPDKTYPLDYIIYRITGYRASHAAGAAFGADAASYALARILEEVGRTVTVHSESIDEPLLTIEDLCARWKASAATIMRWRKAGLPGRLFKFGTARRRIAVRKSLVERFEADRHALIRRARMRRRLSAEERLSILEAARLALDREEPPESFIDRVSKKHVIAKGAVERLLASEARRVPALKAFGRASISQREREAIFAETAAGADFMSVASRYGKALESVRRIWLRGRARRITRRRLKVISSDEFTEEGAEERILGCPFEPSAGAPSAEAAGDLPPYFAGVEDLPILSRENEIALFRRFNFAKFRARELRRKLDSQNPDAGLLDRLEAFLAEADRIRDQIVRSNLRLVIAIARRHFGRRTSFPALVSDGNMALLDAVETFDYRRGNRFSTYAGWAIVRRFARTVPEENYRIASVDHEILDATAGVEVDYSALKPAAVIEGIRRAITGLPERERAVIESRFALDGRERPGTLAEIGAVFGVTKERIRQIELQALERLRKIVETSAPELVP